MRLIIPTRNRAPYLKRILSYYAASDITFPITVADSSTDAEFAENAELIRAHGALEITHERYPADLNPHYKFAQMRQKVAEPFSCVCADDDFIPPASLAAGVAFLKKNADFVLVHGAYAVFHVKQGTSQYSWQPIYRFHDLIAPSPTKRMYAHMTNYYPTIYGLARSKEAAAAYRVLTDNQIDPVLWGELLPSFILPLYGKMRVLDLLWDMRDGYATGRHDWKTLQEFQREGTYQRLYGAMRDAAVPVLSDKAGLAPEEAKTFIDKGVAQYIAHLEAAKRKQGFVRAFVERVRVRAKKELMARRFSKELRAIRARVLE